MPLLAREYIIEGKGSSASPALGATLPAPNLWNGSRLKHRTAIFSLAIIFLAIGTSSLHRTFPDKGWSVRDFLFLPGRSVLLPAGVHFRLPLLHRITRYSAAPMRIPIDLGQSSESPFRPVSREGIPLRVTGLLETRLDPAHLLKLHAEVGADFPDRFVRPLLRTVILENVKSTSYAGTAEERIELELSVEAGLREPLAKLGIRLGTFRVDRLEPAFPSGSPSGEWNPDRARPDARVILIGWDGADWQIIDHLLEEGKMPNLARLLKNGVRVRLKTIEPILSPVIWTTIATGVGPKRHGIIDFVATNTATGEKIPVTSNLRRSQALWNMISNAGLKVGVVGWLATWPAETVNGYLVSDRVASQSVDFSDSWVHLSEGKVYPPGLWDRLEGKIEYPDRIGPDSLRFFFDPGQMENLPSKRRAEEMLEGMKTILASSRTFTSMAMLLRQQEPANFEAIYYRGIDRVSHLFMPYRAPLMEGIDPVEMEILGKVVDRFYQYQDSLLSVILDGVGEETAIILCSDHGFRSGLQRPRTDPRLGHGRAADWHRKYAILLLQGGPFLSGKRLEQASVIDLAPTILAALGLPVPVDLEGKVLVEAMKPSFLKAHPVRYRDPVNPISVAGSGNEPIAAPGDASRRKQLISLGYLSQETTSGHNNLGILYLQEGKIDAAIREFRLSLEKAPGFLAVKINLGRALLARGDTPEARKILRQVALADPMAKEAWVLLAGLAEEEGTEIAEEYFLKALKIDPNDTIVINDLGFLYFRNGRGGEALEQFRKTLEVDPENETAYNNIGLIFRNQGSLQEARQMFEKAIHADPDFLGSYNNLGVTFQDLGNLERAAAAFQDGLDRKPTHTILRNGLGGLFFRMGREEEARKQFEIALQIDPDYEEAHNNLGAVLGVLGDRKGQLRHYHRALQIRDDYSDARYNLAQAYFETGRNQEGIRELERVLESEAGHLQTILALAARRIDGGDLPGAESLLAKAREQSRDNPSLRNLLARIRMKEGREEDARRLWSESLQLDPDQPEVRAQLQALSGEEREPGRVNGGGSIR